MINVNLNLEWDEYRAFELIIAEFRKTTDMFPPYSSIHEAHSILEEEYDEFWDEVKFKPSLRSSQRLIKEAIQVASVAMKIVHQIQEKKIVRGLD